MAAFRSVSSLSFFPCDQRTPHRSESLAPKLIQEHQADQAAADSNQEREQPWPEQPWPEQPWPEMAGRGMCCFLLGGRFKISHQRKDLVGGERVRAIRRLHGRRRRRREPALHAVCPAHTLITSREVRPETAASQTGEVVQGVTRNARRSAARDRKSTRLN